MAGSCSEKTGQEKIKCIFCDVVFVGQFIRHRTISGSEGRGGQSGLRRQNEDNVARIVQDDSGEEEDMEDDEGAGDEREIWEVTGTRD